jgi:hypothetical protein
MWRGCIFKILIALLAIAALYWFWLDLATVDILVYPGGADVALKMNGRRLSPRVVHPESNLYMFGARRGRHMLEASKPGYQTQSQWIVSKEPAEDIYPPSFHLLPVAKPKHRP